MSTRPATWGGAWESRWWAKTQRSLPPRQEMNTLRTQCGQLYAYDWISLPLVYTQVRASPVKMPLWETEVRRTQEAACDDKNSLRG